MVLDYCVAHWWPFIAFWAVLYWADYRLTLVGARLAKAAEDTIVSEGGYELSPEYRDDIAALNAKSDKFLYYLIWGCAYLGFVWSIVTPFKSIPYVYEAFAGMYIIPELVVLLRHAHNLITYPYYISQEGISGRLVFSMWYALRVSALEGLAHAGIYLVLFGLTGRAFFLGGVIGEIVHSRRQWVQSAKEPREVVGKVIVTVLEEAPVASTVE
jgi:hypothetical protein